MPATTMIKKNADMSRRPLNECHGGVGSLDWTVVLQGSDLPGRQLEYIHDDILPPGASIGEHQHKDDEEYYYILSGTGRMTLDGETFDVAAGDITGVFPEGRHALENTGGTDMRILVITVAAPSADEA